MEQSNVKTINQWKVKRNLPRSCIPSNVQATRRLRFINLKSLLALASLFLEKSRRNLQRIFCRGTRLFSVEIKERIHAERIYSAIQNEQETRFHQQIINHAIDKTVKYITFDILKLSTNIKRQLQILNEHWKENLVSLI